MLIAFRGFEIDEITALAQYKGNFDAFMQLSGLSFRDVQWWIGNVQSAFKPPAEDLLTLLSTPMLAWKGGEPPYLLLVPML